MTVEIIRMISEDTSNQMSRKLNESRFSLNSQIQDAITTAIAEKVFSSFQNTLGVQARSNFPAADRRSSGLQRSPEASNPPKIRENHPKSGLIREIQKQVSRQSSVDSYTGEQGRDNDACTGQSTDCSSLSLSLGTVQLSLNVIVYDFKVFRW